jgi:hypothetical protein
MAIPMPEVVFSQAERQLILDHLAHLLESNAFAGSRRRQAFLRYVVEEALAGRGGTIKETTIAINVFGRNSDFDAQHASIVRVTGCEVRKRLAQAYNAMSSKVRIELPVGSYQPIFHVLEPPVPEVKAHDGAPGLSAAAVAAEPASTEPVPAETIRPEPIHPRLSHTDAPLLHPAKPAAFVRKHFQRRWWLVAAVILLGAMGVLAASWSGGIAKLSSSHLDRLWKPFTGDYRPVLLSIETARVLNIRHRDRWLPLRPGETIPTSELEQLESGYVGTGGALGAVLLGGQLVARDQHFVVKFGEDVSFADLKNSPSILVGPSRWALELTRPLRFRMTVSGNHMSVIDGENPGQRWEVERVTYPGEPTEGYSLVTRLISPETRLPALVVLGMDSRNTQAAVEFLSDEASFAMFARNAPPNWDNRNFQIVLHNKIHGHSPGALRVVASQVW